MNKHVYIVVSSIIRLQSKIIPRLEHLLGSFEIISFGILEKIKIVC